MFSLDISRIAKELKNPKVQVVDAVRKQKESTTPLEGDDTYGESPYTYACSQGAFDVVEFLLNKKNYIIGKKQLVNGFHNACKKGHIDLIEFLIVNTKFKLTPGRFGVICSVVSKDIFNKIIILIPGTDYAILDNFGWTKHDYDYLYKLEFLISFGCKVSGVTYLKLLPIASEKTIRKISSGIPEEYLRHTCAYLFERQICDLSPHRIPSELFMPLYNDFFDKVNVSSYDRMIQKFSRHPSSNYYHIILRIIRCKQYVPSSFRHTLRSMCMYRTSELLREFIRLYPFNTQNENDYVDCMCYLIRELSSNYLTQTVQQEMQEKLEICHNSMTYTEPMKQSLIAQANSCERVPLFVSQLIASLQ